MAKINEYPTVNPSGDELLLCDASGTTKTIRASQLMRSNDGSGSLYTLPVATSTTLGGVKPVAKTSAMTQEVGVDSNGRLYTAPPSYSDGDEVSY